MSMSWDRIASSYDLVADRYDERFRDELAGGDHPGHALPGR